MQARGTNIIWSDFGLINQGTPDMAESRQGMDKYNDAVGCNALVLQPS
jgi:hypothetical protein